MDDNVQADVAIRITELPESVGLEQITQLLHKAYAPWLEKGIAFSAATQSAQVTRERMGGGVCLTAFLGDRLVGTVTYFLHTDKSPGFWYRPETYASFFQFAVDPDFQGLKIGKKLFEEVVRRTESAGGQAIVLDTALGAHRLRGMYRAWGFQHVDATSWRSTKYYSVILRKTLDGRKSSNRRCAVRFRLSLLRCMLTFRSDGRMRLFFRAFHALFPPRSQGGNRPGFGLAARGLLTHLYYRLGLLRIRRRMRKRRHCLLICVAPTMEPHLRDYYEQMRGDPALQFSLFYPPAAGATPERVSALVAGTSIREVSARQALVGIWDLAVNADIVGITPFKGAPQIHLGRIPTLYVNHGQHLISYDGGTHTYVYGSGNPCRHEMMFEPNRRIAAYMGKNPVYARAVRFVGCKDADAIREALGHRDAHRQALGVRPDETFVVIFGSWNDTSLFHTLGKELVRAAAALMPEGYRFALSIHPREYGRYREDLEPLGQFVDEQSQNGFLVRQPSQSAIPYLAAADVVLCDYSSMAELAILAKCKLVLSPFSDERIWSQSLLAKARPLLPVLQSADELGELLRAVAAGPLDERVAELAAELDAGPGAYGRNVRAFTRALMKLPPEEGCS